MSNSSTSNSTDSTPSSVTNSTDKRWQIGFFLAKIRQLPLAQLLSARNTNYLLLGIIAFFLLLSVTVSTEPNLITLEHILKTPTWDNGFAGLLGYDELGRSVASRLMAGFKPAFFIACLVVTISMTIGIFIGMVAGYLGGWVDAVIVRLIDIFLAFPGLLLALILAGLLGPGIDNIVIALTVVGWVGFARITRAQVLSIKQQDFVLAARTLGVSMFKIMLTHLLPLIIAPLMVEATFAFAGAILAEAGLSFLGLGIQPPTPSWGQMIRTGAQYMLVAPHYILVPSIALCLVVLSVNRLGDFLGNKNNNF